MFDTERGAHLSQADVLILGAGMCGLAVASALGKHAIVIERESRPGGLVRTERFGDYWFDHVIHILYFPDEETERYIRSLVPDLVLCPPKAWVHAAGNRLRYPFQMHLAGLPREDIVRCLKDLARVSFETRSTLSANFEEMLLSTFGEGMCELFLFPYNRKVWKRPLTSLSAVGFQWTISPPVFGDVVRGALDETADYAAYNSNGWYPRPPEGAPLRGMEVVAASLASQASDLRLNHEVVGIDLDRHLVTCLHNEKEVTFSWRRELCNTLPLPALVRLCKQTPDPLLRAASRLRWNRVISVMFCIRGPRPNNCGHWEYFGDESLSFTRMVYMHPFDPLMAPADGWCLMAEITEPAEEERRPDAEVARLCREDLCRARLLPVDCEIIHQNVSWIDPAYVVFNHDRPAIVEQLNAFLNNYGVTTLGRYGEWDYSSVGRVLRDGRKWALSLLESVPVK